MAASPAPRNGSMTYIALQLITAVRLPIYHESDRNPCTSAPSAPANKTIKRRRSSSYMQRHIPRYFMAPTFFLGLPVLSRQKPSLMPGSFSQSGCAMLLLAASVPLVLLDGAGVGVGV